MFNLKWKKNWFTLAETVIVCTVFAIMILWVIFAINRAYIFLNDTRLRVMATNFARGWVEMMYNIRDTNRRVHPWDKDANWMNAGWTWLDKLSQRIYTIKDWKTSSGDAYIYLTGLEIAESNIDNFYEIEWFFNEDNSDAREKSKIIFTGSYSYNSGWTIATWDLNELMEWFWATFYRVVRVYGVYCKNTTSTNDTSCLTDHSAPKELRFCVKVFYDVNGWHHATELCSIMTNFLE
jgi:hypothetical protein